MSQFERASGVLLHVTSLPSPYGVGDLGRGAYRFVDFLVQSGQRIWQLLPIGPTIQCESPYSCYSAFAGNPVLISPELLVADGFLPSGALQHIENSDESPRQADFVHARNIKNELLRESFEFFLGQAGCSELDEFEAFCTTHKWWLDDFSLFAALMQHFGNDDWCSWPTELVTRDSAALGRWREQLSKEVEYEQYVQYLFFQQWNKLKAYAAANRVQLFGDMPIFVAHGSADVWANQEVFCLDEGGKSTVVAGVPPDYFSKTGQLWGNPLYNWKALEQTDYRWWTNRFRMAFQLYDILRIDHFRGFEAYWEVPADAKTAVNGKWAPGPGKAPFDAARRALGELPIVAEDLGMITEAVHELREQLGFPGMRVLQFGFDSADDLFHRPESYPENSAAYTGTHDNSTIVGWLKEREGRAAGEDILQGYLEDPIRSGMPYHWQLISMVLRSPSDLAIIPLQDILGLDDDSRMNVPGKAHGNWGWRYEASQLTQELIDRLKIITIASDRESVPMVAEAIH
ncbi:4-alpha-glucanotransferase [Aureliella helgolandensis]|uniref:4-alpha-glucanotransferase n=1 Tax=Aureliella helgolandensis TaxID=2527968 RepID=A0A518GAM9_9BACT|nr:4-alpha-glucanotransferase [Aureliella helgolandensis]QDV25658.1 4-alpha-glucanotransferase [Aureliella helgolandensis]